MPKFTDLTGNRFGYLTVLNRAANATDGKTQWLVKCDCGNTCIVRARSLITGDTKSCGCLKDKVDREKLDLAHKAIKTHGLSRTRIYRTYHGMISRCYNPKNDDYDHYGGRGITVCEDWLLNPKDFFKWALNNGYADDLTIERKDNEKGYSPDNCRFIPRADQAKNRRCSTLLTIDEKAQTLSDWAREAGIKQTTLSYRINCGMSPKEAISREVMRCNKSTRN